MTSHLDSHGTTDLKPEKLSGVIGNGMQHDDYNIHGIAHVHACRKKRHFHAKMTIAKLYIYMNSCPKKFNSPRTYLQQLHYPAFAAFFEWRLIFICNSDITTSRD